MTKFDPQKECNRMQTVYAFRDLKQKFALYSWNKKDVLLNDFRHSMISSHLLLISGWQQIKGREILDVGCGTGKWLRTLREWGANSKHLHGIDLLPDRIEKAIGLDPHIDYQVASGWQIPFGSGSMDMISAHTVFSSIVNAEARLKLAQEMYRVLHPEGLILIYDFHVSHPNNPDTVRISKKEVMRLFSIKKVIRKTLTLAPPIQRKVAPISPLLAHALEVLVPFLRTHSFYLIKKDDVCD